MTQIQLANLAEAAKAAKAAEAATGCPALLSVAQWALESGWGAHSPGNNCFGIKARAGEPRQTLMTTEYMSGLAHHIPQDFAVFPDLTACFVRHALLIMASPVYKPAVAALPDFPEFVKLLAKHYATQPDYAKMVLQLASIPVVIKALQEA